MTTISTQEARTHLARYLAEVEQGREYVIARGKKAVAKLVPMKPVKQKSGVIKPVAAGKPAAVKSAKLTLRPKVGETMDAPFDIPASAFAPMTENELKEWGL